MNLSLVVVFPVFVAVVEASGDVLLVSLGPFPEERIQGLLASGTRLRCQTSLYAVLGRQSR